MGLVVPAINSDANGYSKSHDVLTERCTGDGGNNVGIKTQ